MTGGTRVWRQKEAEDFRPVEDEENEEVYDKYKTEEDREDGSKISRDYVEDEGHEKGEVDHWAFQGTDDDEDDDGSLGDRHVC